MLTALVTSCAGTAFYNTLLKETKRERQKGREQEEEDVSNCCITLRNGNVLETENESTRSHGPENAVWKRLWTCPKKDYVMTKQEYTHS
jgi:hypothetical protein